MTKTEFLDRLRHGLQGLPEKDILSSLDYYAEMIDDRMESGMEEADAIAVLGIPEEIARAIILDLPLPKVIKSKCTQKRVWRAWEITLLILGSPLWLSLLLVAASLLLVVYAVLWVAVACLWSVDVAFGGVSLGCVVVSLNRFTDGSPLSALLYLGMVLLAAGLAVVSFFPCIKLTAVFARLSARLGRWIKSWFVGKGAPYVEG